MKREHRIDFINGPYDGANGMFPMEFADAVVLWVSESRTPGFTWVASFSSAGGGAPYRRSDAGRFVYCDGDSDALLVPIVKCEVVHG